MSENITDIEVIADEPTVESPDGLPNPNYPELPMEDKKKAVNLQDLVFVRQYVDNKLEEKLNSDVPGIVREELGDEYYNKTETDEKFYKKTDTVANATVSVFL